MSSHTYRQSRVPFLVIVGFMSTTAIAKTSHTGGA
jgi:hypothetical protein